MVICVVHLGGLPLSLPAARWGTPATGEPVTWRAGACIARLASCNSFLQAQHPLLAFCRVEEMGMRIMSGFLEEGGDVLLKHFAIVLQILLRLRQVSI